MDRKDKPRRQQKSALVRRIFLFGVIALILGAGVFAGYYLLSERVHMRETAVTIASKIPSFLQFDEAEKGSIQLSELNGYFVTRGKDNRIFVIEGKATNRYSSPCSFLRVNGILFDEKGEVAVKEVAYCGNMLDIKELQTYSKKILQEKLENAYGSTLSNLNVEPNQTLPFMLVFFDPPANISEYSAEVADFKTAPSKGP